jgi:hypothetical protein
VQQEYENEAMGPDDFKFNYVYDAGTIKERQPSKTVKEMEKMSEVAQGKEEENTVEMLTPWEKEIEMLEDWLNHTQLVYDYHGWKIMQKLAEESSEELLKNFSQRAEQMMMTAMLRHVTEDEGKPTMGANG